MFRAFIWPAQERICPYVKGRHSSNSISARGCGNGGLRAFTVNFLWVPAKLWGVVAAKPELDNGGQVTTGDWSVSSVLSHEVLEMFIDPNCNLWANDGTGSAYSFEVCDPVEAPAYDVGGVSVSNFVTPSWFDPLAAASAQFDKLGQLKAPFSIVKGGYVVYESAGKEQQKFGDEFPEWRKQMKARSEERRVGKECRSRWSPYH